MKQDDPDLQAGSMGMTLQEVSDCYFGGKKVFVLPQSWAKLLAHLLERASDEFSSHGCNDLLLAQYMSREERHELCRAIENWNGTPHDYDPSAPYNYSYDWLVMSFFADMFGADDLPKFMAKIRGAK